jgi:hypothetical protein
LEFIMADTSSINLSQAGTMSPEDYAQQQQINRQQQMAQMLLQQTQQPAGQVISGRYVAPSWAQQLVPLANIAASKYIGSTAESEATKLAQKLRAQEIADIQKYNQILKGTSATPGQEQFIPQGQTLRDDNGMLTYGAKEARPGQAAIPGDANAANLFAASSYSPVLRAMGLKRMTEGPDWKEGKLEQSDGSVITGWYDAKAPNPRATFIEGGTKPAFTSLDAEKFFHETGRYPPGYQPYTGKTAPVQASTGKPIPGAPVQAAASVAPSGAVQASVPVNRPVAQMSSQPGNQPITVTGNAVPVSAMNRPGMSPKDLSEANKQVFVESEKQRQADLKALPGALEQAKNAIATVDQMIGDARLNDKGEIVYKKYDPVSKQWTEGAEPHGGFGQYVGLGVPFWSNVEGTDTASFRTLYDSLKGQAFLEAFKTLKGSGQITEIEGQKATEALLKLNKAQSEKDFIKYAREFQENLQKGMELAKNKAGVAPGYRSPVDKPVMRWNPQTNSWVTQ